MIMDFYISHLAPETTENDVRFTYRAFGEVVKVQLVAEIEDKSNGLLAIITTAVNPIRQATIDAAFQYKKQKQTHS